MEPKEIVYQVETFNDGMLYPDLVTFTGDYAILIEKKVENGNLITTQKPTPIGNIVRITVTRPAEIREAPKTLLTEEDTKESGATF